MKKIAFAAACAVALSGCATSYNWEPVATQGVETTYQHGVATAESRLQGSSVKVSPLGFNGEGQVQFGVAVFNSGKAAVEIKTSDITITGIDGSQIRVFDKETLERQVRNRAMIAAIAVAAAGGVSAAAAQQNAYSTTHATMRTPTGGTYVYSAQTYSPTAAAIGVTAATAATAVSLNQISNTLDQTIAGLNGVTLQRTTIQPGLSYGGVVTGDRLKNRYPQELTLAVAVGGETHNFKFVVSQAK